MIPTDIIFYIALFLRGKSKKNWLSANKKHRRVFYNEFLKEYTVSVDNYYRFPKSHRCYIKKISNITKILPPNIFLLFLYRYVYGICVTSTTIPVTHIELSDSYNGPLPPNMSTTIQMISTGREFNVPSKQANFPISLTQLKFGCHYNKPIDHLPPFLEKLYLGRKFNCKITFLPESLTGIYFEPTGEFNQSITYPKFLRYIRFSNKFNQSIDDLPDSVEYIRIGTGFALDILRLPASLKEIHFPKNYNKQIIKSGNIKICFFST